MPSRRFTVSLSLLGFLFLLLFCNKVAENYSVVVVCVYHIGCISMVCTYCVVAARCHSSVSWDYMSTICPEVEVWHRVD
jgi:hypothetical protein